MSTVTEAVKQSLVGSSEQPQLSHQIKSNFNQYARKDEQTGDLYMSEDDFINAVAPKQEDYVSCSLNQFLPFPSPHCRNRTSWLAGWLHRLAITGNRADPGLLH